MSEQKVRVEGVNTVGMQSHSEGITVAPTTNTITHGNQQSLLNTQDSALNQRSQEVVAKGTASGTALYELQTIPAGVTMARDSSVTMETGGPITVASGTELGEELVPGSLPTETGSSVVEVADRKPDLLPAATPSVPVDLVSGSHSSTVETIIIQQTTESGEIQEIALPIQQAQTLLSGAGITGVPGLSYSLPGTPGSTPQASTVSADSNPAAPTTTTTTTGAGYTEIMIPANQVVEYMQQMTGQSVTFVTQ